MHIYGPNVGNDHKNVISCDLLRLTFGNFLTKITQLALKLVFIVILASNYTKSSPLLFKIDGNQQNLSKWSFEVYTSKLSVFS